MNRIFFHSGTGAATAIVTDSENVVNLGRGLLARKRTKMAGDAAAQKRCALTAQYASSKMDAILAWAKAGRMFFVTQQEAEEIRGGRNISFFASRTVVLQVVQVTTQLH